ncbi:MAG: DUF2270 domain-containing protein [Acidobacteriota bacterium]|nr:DUF2270 domain-containing protein [Acidobacteriota bacterium]MDH3531089.1 DUF2270 domain-containing protein [Acidobacteriota bacterium]
MSDRIHETEDAFVENLRAKTKNPALRELTEEVSERQRKPKNKLSSVPKKLTVGEFNTAMVHFYRGELQRSNTWRRRLDTTTNWAVLTAGATLSFVFSSPNNPHFAIPINTLLVTIFLFMEARRFRYYEVWANRVRVIEAGYFAPMLSYHCLPPDKEWAEHISEDLLRPEFTISEWEALGRRLRSNYAWIFVLLALSWTLKVYVHPTPAADLAEFLYRAHVGLAPGWLVILAGFIFNSLLLLLALVTLRLTDATSEVEPREEMEWRSLQEASEVISADTGSSSK